MESHNNCVDTFPTASQQRGSERSLGGVEIDNQTVAQRFARGARVNDCGAVTMWLCSASILSYGRLFRHPKDLGNTAVQSQLQL